MKEWQALISAKLTTPQVMLLVESCPAFDVENDLGGCIVDYIVPYQILNYPAVELIVSFGPLGSNLSGEFCTLLKCSFRITFMGI